MTDPQRLDDIPTVPADDARAVGTQRPAGLKVLLSIVVFQLAVECVTAGGAILLVALAADGELTGFLAGVIEGMGYDPAHYSLTDAGRIVGSQIFRLGLYVLYILALEGRWRRIIYGVFALDVLMGCSFTALHILLFPLRAYFLFRRDVREYLAASEGKP